MTSLEESFGAKRRKVLDDSERFKRELRKVRRLCVMEYTSAEQTNAMNILTTGTDLLS